MLFARVLFEKKSKRWQNVICSLLSSVGAAAVVGSNVDMVVMRILVNVSGGTITLKEIVRAWGLNPEEILTKDAFAKPNAAIIEQEQFENVQLRQLSDSLKQQMLKEIREDQNGEKE